MRGKFFFILPVIVILFIVGFVPIFYSFVLSFFDERDGNLVYVGLKNYKNIIEDDGFLLSLNITFLWAFIHALITIFISFTLALYMSDEKGIYKLMYFLIFVPLGIPIYISVPVWRAIIHGEAGRSILNIVGLKVNLLTDTVKSFFATISISVWLSIPVTTLIFFFAIRNVRYTFVEAMRVDGADYHIIFRSLYIPLLKKYITLMFLLDFVKSIKEFNVIFMSTNGGPPLLCGFTKRAVIGATTTMQVYIYKMFDSFLDSTKLSAYSVMVFFIVVSMVCIWIFGDEKNKGLFSIIPFVVSIFHIAFGKHIGLLFCSLYLLSILNINYYRYVLLFDVTINFISIVKYGFLKGMNPATIVAVVGYVILYILTYDGTYAVKSTKLYNVVFRIISYITSFLMIISVVLVIWSLLWLSFSKANVLFFDSFLPKYFTTENYINIFTKERIHVYFINTAFVSFIVSILIPLFAFPPAYIFSRSKSRKNLTMLLMSFSEMSGGIHTLVPLFFLFSILHLVNTYVPLVIVYIAHSISFSVYTMKNFLDSVPTSLDDQAKIDGMKTHTYVFTILFRVSLPVIATSMIVSFLNAWNGFLVPLIFLMDDNKYTIGIKIFSFVGSIGSASPKWGVFASTSILNLLITSILFIIFKRPIYVSHLSQYDE